MKVRILTRGKGLPLYSIWESEPQSGGSESVIVQTPEGYGVWLTRLEYEKVGNPREGEHTEVLEDREVGVPYPATKPLTQDQLLYHQLKEAHVKACADRAKYIALTHQYLEANEPLHRSNDLMEKDIGKLRAALGTIEFNRIIGES